MRRFIPLVLLVLVSCASFKANTPGQRLFAAQADYNGVLALAVAYESQPRCSPVPVQPCSDTAIVMKMRAADDLTWSLLANAKTVVRDPNSAATTVSAAINAALAAVTAFKSVVGEAK